MKEIFVPYEIAVKFKEIGFNAPCIAIYSIHNNELKGIIQGEEKLTDNFILGKFTCSSYSGTPAPTWEQVFKWFRKKGYFTDITYLVKYKKYYFDIIFERKEEFDKHNKDRQMDFNNSLNFAGEYNTYKKCREVLVLKLIEIYKKWKSKKN